jgi:hypothetical protein
MLPNNSAELLFVPQKIVGYPQALLKSSVRAEECGLRTAWERLKSNVGRNGGDNYRVENICFY